MFMEADEFSELFKGLFPVYLLYILPIILIMSPMSVSAASHEFPVYRVSQYDLHGSPRGFWSSVTQVNLEARSIRNWSSRQHCVITRLDHLSTTVMSLFKKTEAVGALLIILPTAPQQMSDHVVQELSKVLSILTSEDISIPVYLISWSTDIQKILDEIDDTTSFNDSEDEQRSGKRTSSMESGTLTTLLLRNSYQIVLFAPQPQPRQHAAVTSIQGKLTGYGEENKNPTIVIVAHYDALSVAPELSYGAESNASGVVMLLELCRLISLLYASSRSKGLGTIFFLLSGGGTLNYQGSKKWIEDQLESEESTLLQDVEYVLCLDTVSSPNLQMHVSKPPREGSALYNFHSDLLKSSGNNVEIVHKKINLSDHLLAWEHEKYSLKRIPATTISSIKSHKKGRKDGLFDVPERIDIKSLTKNIEIIASALARHIYNISRDPSPFSQQHLGVNEDQVRAWIEFLATHSRSPSLLYENNNPLIKALHLTMKRYLETVDVVHQTAYVGDPEFVFYDSTKASINIYKVKPAVFDLFLTVLITLYLTAFFLVIQNFHLLYATLVPSTSKKMKVK